MNEEEKEKLESDIEKLIESEKLQNDKDFELQSKHLERFTRLLNDNHNVDVLVEMCKDMKPYRHVPELFKELITKGFIINPKNDEFYDTKYDLFINLVEFLEPQFPLDLPQTKITTGCYACEILPNILRHLKSNMVKGSEGLKYVYSLEELANRTMETPNRIKEVIESIDATKKYFSFPTHENKQYLQVSGFNLLKLFDFFKTKTINANLTQYIIIVSLFYNVDPTGKDYADEFNLLLAYNTCAIVAMCYYYYIMYYLPGIDDHVVIKLFKKPLEKIIDTLYVPIGSAFGARLTNLKDTRKMSLLHSCIARNKLNIISEISSFIVIGDSNLLLFLRKFVPRLRSRIGSLLFKDKDKDKNKVTERQRQRR